MRRPPRTSPLPHHPVASSRPIRLVLLGAGNVGSGIARTLREKRAAYAAQLGRPLELAGIIVRDPTRVRNGVEGPEQELISADDSLLGDPGIDIVVDAFAGEEPALGYITQAICAGKYVVTANKEVMAKHGARLLALARDHGVDVLFEASVGGGIPIIAPLKRDLLANRILSVAAIINGTTNYILTAMSRDGADFGATLAQAQQLGYAEANPANDVEGEDARYKLAILASLAFRIQVRPDQIYREGITALSARDFRYAKELGYEIKLLALARAEQTGIRARVHPALIGIDEPLAKVDGVLNAVQIEGDLTGRVLFEGRGAGSLPTTSAVIADVLDAARSIAGGRREVHSPEETEGAVLTMDELLTRYYIRITVADQPLVLAQIARALGEGGISISSVIQKETFVDARTAELVIMTHEAREASMYRAIEAVKKLSVVESVGNFIRVEHL